MAFYEINAYTDKPDEFKLFQTVDQTNWTTVEATIFENYNTPNSSFDMSSVYVNVDANCPWTDGKIWDTFDNTTGINEATYENGEVSIMPVLPNAISQTQPSHTLTLGYGNNQGKKYFNFQSWNNPKQELVKYQHSNIMYGNWNQIGTLKFGGQAIVAVPYLTVADSSNRTQTCDLYTYLNTYFDTYTLINYIEVRFFTFNTTASASAQGLHLPTDTPRGNRWTTSQGYPRISMVPIIKNETVKYRQASGVDLTDIEVSLFDTYVSTASTNNDRYEAFIIFGTTINSNLKNYSGSVNTHVLSVDKLSAYYESGNYIYAGHTDRNVLGSTKEAFREAIRRRVAYFGLFFTDRSAILYNSSASEWTTYDELFSHEEMHCGTIDGSGTTHGDYTSGKKNYGQKQFGSTDLAKDSGAKPITPGGGGGDRPKPDPDKNPVLPGKPGFNLAAKGCQTYVLTSSNFEEMWDDIYLTKKGKWKDLLEGLALFGSNPLNAILGYRWVPFTLRTTGAVSPIVLGSTVVNEDHEYPTIISSNAFYQSGGSFWYGYDKNFINSKHCKCRLWLPFYGFVELPMSQMLSKELEISFQYNVPDDLGVWIISFGNVIYDYYECAPYIDIPITGDNSAQIAIAKQQQAINTALTVGSAAVTIGAGIAAGVASGGFGLIADAFSGGFVGGLDILAHAASYGIPASEMMGIATGVGAIGTGLNTAAKAGGNIVSGRTQTANQVGTLSTNVPTKAGASATTFLHLPMKPYIQFYTNIDMETANIAQYKRTVGIACEQWSTIGAMPDNSLLSISNPVFDTSGMTENEVNALITALGGFVK